MPVKRNLGNLVELIKTMIDDDETAKAVALNGQKYGRENLAPHNIFGYYLLLFQVSTTFVNTIIYSMSYLT